MNWIQRAIVIIGSAFLLLLIIGALTGGVRGAEAHYLNVYVDDATGDSARFWVKKLSDGSHAAGGAMTEAGTGDTVKWTANFSVTSYQAYEINGYVKKGTAVWVRFSYPWDPAAKVSIDSLNLIIDTLYAALDTLQNQDNWGAKQADLLKAIDSLALIIDSLQAQDDWIFAKDDSALIKNRAQIAQQFADSVLMADTAANNGAAGSFGAVLANPSYVQGPASGLTAADIWDEPRAGHTTAGTFGYYLDAAISTRSTLTASDNIGINWANIANPSQPQTLGGTSIGSVAGSVGSIGSAGISSGSIAPGALTSAKFGAGFILSTSFAANSITDAAVNAGALNGKGDWKVSSTFPSNFDALAITAGGAVTVGTNNDKTGYTASTVTDKTGYTVSTVQDKTGYALSASGVDAIWDETQSGHTTAGTFGYNLDAQVSLASGGSAVWSIAHRDSVLSGLLRGSTPLIGGDLANWYDDAWTYPTRTIQSVSGSVGSVTGAVGSVTGNVGGNVVGSVGSVTGSVGSVAGNVGGNVTGSVGSVTGNVGGNVVGSVASVSGSVGGNVVGSVGSLTGAVTVGTNNDKTGYSISGTLTTLDALGLTIRNQLDTMSMWLGIAPCSKSKTHYQIDADTVFVYCGSDLLGRLVFYHPSGTPGAAPDTTKVVVP